MIPSPWTPELIEKVRGYAATGLTASQIASRIHKTRNSVVSICYRKRIKLSGNKPTMHRVQRERPEKPKAAPAKIRKPVEARVSVEALMDRAAKHDHASVSIPICEQDFPHRVSFVHAELDHCRFPLWGDDRNIPISERFFCGSPALPGSSYCTACWLRVYTSGVAA